jgi:hypothetical protein
MLCLACHAATPLGAGVPYHLLRCYGVELSAGGQRRFLITTPQQLWQDYTQLLPQQRCHYEIIREASPCHLYLGRTHAPLRWWPTAHTLRLRTLSDHACSADS